MRLPYRILVLQEDPRSLSGLVHLLRDADYLVTGAATSDAAKRLLAVGTFDLLITDARLGSSNGGNLVKHAGAAHPEMAVLVMGEGEDPGQLLEARRYHAQFFKRAVEPHDLLATVSRCLKTVRRPRRWERKRIDRGFHVLAHGLSAAVIDVCYGGLRLEFTSLSSVPDTFDVEIGGIGLHLVVEKVWTARTPEGQFVTCGAALVTDATPAARTWRAIVDRL